MNIAKLYGYEAPPPPSQALEWDLRWLMLGPDGILWHADMYDNDEGAWGGDIGRINLHQVKGAALSAGGKELVLSQEGRCHLITQEVDATEDSLESLTVQDVMSAISMLGLAGVSADAETATVGGDV